jgi:hypothetical protein
MRLMGRDVCVCNSPSISKAAPESERHIAGRSARSGRRWELVGLDA